MSEETQATEIPIRDDTPKSRLTVVQTVSFLQEGAEPVVADSRWGRWLDTDEQPYVRRLRVGKEWKRLEEGWLRFPAFLVLVNDEKDPSKVIEVGLAPPSTVYAFWEIPPGGSMSGVPKHVENIMLRCPGGEARAIFYLFPGDMSYSR